MRAGGIPTMNISAMPLRRVPGGGRAVPVVTQVPCVAGVGAARDMDVTPDRADQEGGDAENQAEGEEEEKDPRQGIDWPTHRNASPGTAPAVPPRQCPGP